MLRRLAEVVLVCALASAAAHADPPSPDVAPEEQYRRGKALFDVAECARAIETLAPLAVPGNLQDERQQLDVHLMLGVCYADGKRSIDAAREFSSLLAIDPDFAADSFQMPPPAVEALERQKAVMKQQLDEIRRAKEKAKKDGALDTGALLIIETRTVKQVPWPTAFLPFGLAQAENGETLKAVLFATIQGAFLVANIALGASSVVVAGGEDPTTDAQAEAKEATYTTLVAGNWIALGGLALSYAVGVGDALWDREDGKVVDQQRQRRVLTPDEARRLTAAPAPQPAQAP